MTIFTEKYTTKTLKIKNPEQESNKIEVTDDTYAMAEILDNVAAMLKALNAGISRLRLK
jgi:hypothetical protein